MTRDHLLGWTHAAQLIADSMPAPVKPCPVRLVPVTERVGVADVDPVKAAGLKKRAQEAEQAAFEAWLARVRPSGDIESVQQQWEDSSDYADFLEVRDEAPAAAPAALVDGQVYKVRPPNPAPGTWTGDWFSRWLDGKWRVACRSSEAAATACVQSGFQNLQVVA
jgi:hypothetical protein